MAVITFAEAGFFGSTSAASTTPITLSAGIAGGRVGLVMALGDVTGITDSRSNAWAKQADFLKPTGNSLQRQSIWTAPITTALQAGDVVTIAHSNGNFERHASIFDVDGIDATANATGGSQWDWSSGFSTQAWSALAGFTPTGAKDLVVQFACNGGVATNCAFGGWATDGGGVAFGVARHTISGGSYATTYGLAQRSASGVETPSGLISNPGFSWLGVVSASFSPAPEVPLAERTIAMLRPQSVHRAVSW